MSKLKKKNHPSFLCNPHPGIYLLILKREEAGEIQKKRERETSMWERNINWLHSVHALTRDQIATFRCRDDAPTKWATWLGQKKFHFKAKRSGTDIEFEVVRQLNYQEDPKSIFCVFKVLWDEVVNVRKKKIPKPRFNSRASVCPMSPIQNLQALRREGADTWVRGYGSLGGKVQAPAIPLVLLSHTIGTS